MFHIRNNKILPNIPDCKTWGEKARAAITPHQRAGDKVKSISNSLSSHQQSVSLGKILKWPLGVASTSVQSSVEDCISSSQSSSSSVHFWSSCRLQQTLSNIKTWHWRQQSWKAGQGNTRAMLKGHREEISKPLPGIFGLGRKTRCPLQAWDRALRHIFEIGGFLYHFKIFQMFTSLLCKRRSTRGFLPSR